MKSISSLVPVTIFIVLIENMVAKYLLVALDQENKVERGSRGPWSPGKKFWLLGENFARDF